MTEDMRDFVNRISIDDRERAPRLPRSIGWHLCEADLEVIDDLHATCVEWLPHARDAKAAREIAFMLEALEAIAAG